MSIHLQDSSSGSDLNFLQETERDLELKKENLTDVEWERKNRKWEDQREKMFVHMLKNNIWGMISQKQKGMEMETRTFLLDEDAEAQAAIKLEEEMKKKQSVVQGHKKKTKTSLVAKPMLMSQHATNVSNVSRIVWKVPKWSQLDLFRFLGEWDKASYGKRDRIILEFLRVHETRERLYDTDSVFHNGGSLVFCRFAVGLHICFKKSRQVWHYYDALGIFAKSLQSDRYTEEFLKVGGMNCIIQVVRVQESTEKDKLHAFRFLEHLMRGRNGHAVKQFVCDNPLFLESMIDSLTMCKSKDLIQICGQVFQTLCIETPSKNVSLVYNYIMHALHCDFNPPLQAMAFNVLQSIVRLKPQLAAKCIKPILDNLKTNSSELLIEMSNLSLVILATAHGEELISSLLSSSDGIQMRDVFRSTFLTNLQVPPSSLTAQLEACQNAMMENIEKAKLKQMEALIADSEKIQQDTMSTMDDDMTRVDDSEMEDLNNVSMSAMHNYNDFDDDLDGLDQEATEADVNETTLDSQSVVESSANSNSAKPQSQKKSSDSSTVDDALNSIPVVGSAPPPPAPAAAPRKSTTTARKSTTAVRKSQVNTSARKSTTGRKSTVDMSASRRSTVGDSSKHRKSEGGHHHHKKSSDS